MPRYIPVIINLRVFILLYRKIHASQTMQEMRYSKAAKRLPSLQNKVSVDL